MFKELMTANIFLILCEEILHGRDLTEKQVKREFRAGDLTSNEAHKMIITTRKHYVAQTWNVIHRHGISVN